MTVQISFKEAPRDLQLSPWFWPFVSRKTYPNIWTFRFWEFWTVLEHPPIFTRVQADTASAAGPSQPCNLVLTSIIFAAVNLGRRQAVFSKNKQRLQSRLLQCLPGARLCLETSVIVVPTPNFWGDICPSVKQSGLHVSLCAFRITSFLGLEFSKFHAGIVSSFSNSLSTAAFASGILIPCGIGMNLRTKS